MYKDGRRELFAGLAAEEIFDRTDYRQHPIIRLDFMHRPNEAGSKPSAEAMRKTIRP